MTTTPKTKGTNMMNRKTRFALLCALLCAISASAAVPEGWTDDFAAAQKTAEKSRKPMAVLFTGSDWCPWCVRLADEILLKKDFRAASSNDFVFVYLDYPSDESLQTPARRAANRTLLEKYGVRGFPTLLVMDAKGAVLGKTGYRRVSAKEYAEHLRRLSRAASEPNPPAVR